MIINYDNINDPKKSPLRQVRLFHRRSSEPTSPSWVPWSRVRGFGDQKSTRLKRGLAVFPPLDFDGFWHFCGASHFFWWTWMSDVTTATVTYFAMFSWRNRQFFFVKWRCRGYHDPILVIWRPGKRRPSPWHNSMATEPQSQHSSLWRTQQLWRWIPVI